jgi:hypothetical protein
LIRKDDVGGKCNVCDVSEECAQSFYQKIYHEEAVWKAWTAVTE